MSVAVTETHNSLMVVSVKHPQLFGNQVTIKVTEKSDQGYDCKIK